MMTRQEAEEMIHLLRHIVNTNFEATQQKKDFDPEAHNLCMIHCEFNGFPDQTFFSYSAMSAFSKGAIRQLNVSWGLEFVPDVAPHLQGFNCQGMGKFHTEPRLLNNLFFRPGFIENISELTIVTEIPVCTSCRNHTVQPFRTAYPHIPVTIHDLSMNPGQGNPPQYTFPHLQL